MSLEIEQLESWESEFQTDLTYQLSSTVLKNYNADDILLNKSRLLSQDQRIYNTRISDIENITPVTNQKASGRCWLFAATNQLRIQIVKDLNLKDFELSQAYLFFYDKLEKANYFIDQIIDTAKTETDDDSRLIQYLLEAPTNDGGQYSMFLNIVKKYGLVPKSIYNDLAYSTTASRKLNSILTSKLREFAETLRVNINDMDKIKELRTSMQKEIYKLMTMFMEVPPIKPNEKFVWEYIDKDKKIGRIECTPLEFAIKYAHLDLSDNKKLPVSLINDPRHEYGKLIKIDRLGNVIGGDDVIYLNVDNDTLSKLVVKRLQNDKAVFFGSDTPKFMDKSRGVMDVQLWNYNAIGYNLHQTKASRIKYHQSMMTHAMLITACHVEEGKELPTRYCVENSWGKDSGKDGLYLMTQDYFEEYCYQIVVDMEDLPSELQEKFLSDKEEPIVLPIWDPMGALAK
ncbi:bleomycin hydrolase NDAI_0F03900 [Naumovozyma dairenensis CBS 421]|uniref:Cysteine proteinase 1, mitochondrial n=1 Tax=Naumovozyma dairenensis (strain ATCC 10597 / BCRC 20456 / CBS 421 / NBRC 0211 / NRRL Y-12639) TaxID=1071378 RepID=G0WD47_NAUDC|nr:hypothetical protein NDAI_0F03900 [Naumovozyma dairenensis CBS 421]CCD25708.1 hypothetical protein NDAI_0F03900 [Naumovozyma dairenensis CBS 421]